MSASQVDDFERERRTAVARMSEDRQLKTLSRDWLIAGCAYNYSYNFSWMGRPIIQYPQDIVAMQEIVWRVKPDLIVETGIARGGSLVFYASLLEVIGGRGMVVGIDIHIRPANRAAIERHPMIKRIKMIEGSSTDDSVIRQVSKAAARAKRVLVALDSSHTHDHVARELALYSPFVTKGSYLVVFDTIVENVPEVITPGRPWAKGNNPMTAVREFLRSNNRFEVDEALEAKLLISVAPSGYLKCVRT